MFRDLLNIIRSLAASLRASFCGRGLSPIGWSRSICAGADHLFLYIRPLLLRWTFRFCAGLCATLGRGGICLSFSGLSGCRLSSRFCSLGDRRCRWRLATLHRRRHIVTGRCGKGCGYLDWERFGRRRLRDGSWLCNGCRPSRLRSTSGSTLGGPCGCR